MPIYSFTCAKGHVTDDFCFVSDQRPAIVPCSTCGEAATFDFTATFRDSSIFVDDDCPVHYNPTIGEVVRSRRHLRDIQKRSFGERGIEMQNYEPVKPRPSRPLHETAHRNDSPTGVILGREESHAE